MTNMEILIERYPDEEFLQADGFEEAIIGIDQNFRVCYSNKKCIEILAKDMSLEEAADYFLFNVAGAYVGEKTPIFVDEILV